MKLQLLDSYGEVLESWDASKVLWQIIEKKHVNDELSNKKWEEFINVKQDNFSEITSETAQELYDYFEQGE